MVPKGVITFALGEDCIPFYIYFCCSNYLQCCLLLYRILFFSTLLLVPLLGGTSAFGLLTVNEIWDISEWLFMAFSIATVWISSHL